MGVRQSDDKKQIDEKMLIEKIKVWFTNYKGKNIVNFIDYGTKEEAQNLIFLSKKYYKRS